MGVLFWSGWGDARPAIPSRQNQLTIALAERVPLVTTDFIEPTFGLPGATIAKEEGTERMIARIDLGALGRLRPRRLRRWATPGLAPSLHAVLRAADIREYALFLMGSRGPHTTLGLQRRRTVVDLIDPPFVAASREIFRQQVPILTKGARLVTATSAELADEARQAGVEAVVVPNACVEVAPLPSIRPAVPTVGYLGSLDWRFDVQLVAEVARAMPEVRFVLAGRQLDSLQPQLRALRGLVNVDLPGAVPPSDTTATLGGFSVGIVPFRTGFIGDAINPVKVYEYLAVGVPVLASPIRECREMDLVSCAGTPDEWVAAIRELLNKDDGAASMSRRDFASRNTWRVRADALVDLMVDRGLIAPTAVRSRTPSTAAATPSIT
jgi:glycosyltransferase involved in cell wall biosynthesis